MTKERVDLPDYRKPETIPRALERIRHASWDDALILFQSYLHLNFLNGRGDGIEALRQGIHEYVEAKYETKEDAQ
jgi:hypothetical protein